jgi:methylphosphotriester-DNA--protein-cysteine methyltransferase
MASIVLELAFRLSRYKGFGWVGATGRPPEISAGDYVAFHAASAIYSAELVKQCGVSVRTLGTAVASVRGMSLHHYLRLKQLWSARAQLVRGSDVIAVTSCARANGFHHMGEFARKVP